jgi:alkanesulfonate monooxygenase SsuD/methylene tetrahydromethanopterin reductase-like flavin-dependent oxidoreductase (luciferase family)
VGRHADIWNGFPKGDDNDWLRKVDIVHRSAVDAGRDPADIEISQTIEKALPETDAESAELFEFLVRKVELGVRHFVMDFGNPTTDEHVLRFVEQVMTPLKEA